MQRWMKLQGTAVLLICAASQAGAADLYRYVNDRGITVLDRGVPPQFVSKGYEVLDADGRIKLVVPAALTPEEREAVRLAEREQDRQRSEDQTLLRLYSSVADLDRAQARKIQQIEGLIATHNNGLLSLKTQREELQSRAAVQERAGRKVDRQVLLGLQDVAVERQQLQRKIDSHRAEIDTVKQSFASQRQRLEQLLAE